MQLRPGFRSASSGLQTNAWYPLSYAVRRRAGRQRRARAVTLIDPDEIHGLDGLMAEAVTLKFIPAPLTKDQIAELIQVQK